MSSPHNLIAQINDLVARLNPQTQKLCFNEIDQVCLNHQEFNASKV